MCYTQSNACIFNSSFWRRNSVSAAQIPSPTPLTPLQAIPRSWLWIKTTVVVLFEAGLDESRRGGMCSAEEGPALGHPSSAGPERLGMDGSARHRDLQLALLPGKGMRNPPHSRAIFEEMKLDRTFSFPLLGGSGIRERGFSSRVYPRAVCRE